MRAGASGYALGFALASAIAFTAPPSVAAAPTLALSPDAPKPGDAVLITVAGAKERPKGSAGGRPLQFFAAKGGYQALARIPLATKPERLQVRVEARGAGPFNRSVPVAKHEYPETSLAVEDEFVEPPPELRGQIEEDRKAVARAYAHRESPPLFQAPFVVPVPGKVTSPFGQWRTFNDKHRSQHTGVDIAAAEGTPVRASNDGEVVLAKDLFLSGKTVIVHHGADVYTAYLHLSDASVKEGDRVKRGAVIARAGQTGRTTGPHLHWAVKVGGEYVDPMTFLTSKLRPTATPATKTD